MASASARLVWLWHVRMASVALILSLYTPHCSQCQLRQCSDHTPIIRHSVSPWSGSRRIFSTYSWSLTASCSSQTSSWVSCLLAVCVSGIIRPSRMTSATCPPLPTTGSRAEQATPTPCMWSPQGGGGWGYLAENKKISEDSDNLHKVSQNTRWIVISYVALHVDIY